MEYEILYNDTTEGLAEDVNSCMVNGWEPLGGIAIRHRTWENERKGYQEEEETEYFQAMIKR